MLRALDPTDADWSKCWSYTPEKLRNGYLCNLMQLQAPLVKFQYFLEMKIK